MNDQPAPFLYCVLNYFYAASYSSTLFTITRSSFFLLSSIARSRGTVTRGSFFFLFTITGCRGAVSRSSVFFILAIPWSSFLSRLRTVARSWRFLFYLGANCTLFSTASATGGRSSLFLAASATGAHGGTAHACYQAGNAEPGQHFFQVFLFHLALLLFKSII